MSSWNGKSKGGVLGYKIFIALLKHLPLSWVYLVLHFVSFYYFIFTNKSGIKYYFRQRLNYPILKTYRCINKNFYIFGQTLLDKIAVLSGITNRFTFEMDGEQYLREAVANRQGGILVGAHMGNWEIAGQFLTRLEAPINIVMFDGEQNNIKDLLEQVMVKKSVHIILMRENDDSHLYEIHRALQNKELIAFHGDRYLSDSRNITCQFLGAPAKFPAGPFYLAIHYQVPVFFVNAMKDTPTHYHFYSTPGRIYPKPGNKKERDHQLKKMVSDYVAELERILMKYPLQWFNYHHFWCSNQ